MKKKKFYVVWVGQKPGVYSDWEECKAQIHGYENAVYKSFGTQKQAEEAFTGDSKDFIGINQFESTLSVDELKAIGSPLEDGLCVDGAWNTKTNAIEYQGVKFIDKEPIFHAGPFSAGTNNIAEFLAIVHALAHCKNRSLLWPIYSDSRTAISWIKKKKAATKIEKSSATVQILNIVDRAEQWLKSNEYPNKILKWETAAWGENPADFGRK